LNALNRPDQGPVAIGGVGGSGTRLVANIVSQCGFYLGSSLNDALDNLWFTILFQRPSWFDRFPSDEEIIRSLTLFGKAMTTGLFANISESETDYIWEIFHELESAAIRTGADRTTAEQLIASKSTNFANHIGWGWKEPNTHIFLPQIAAAFAGVRYIHVMRNGLDMAFSKNQRQVGNWGDHFGISLANGGEISPSISLDFWIAANRRAIDVGKRLLKDRFHLVNFETLCFRPGDEIDRLVDFLGVPLSRAQFATMKQAPKLPPTIERYRNFDIAQFSQAQMEAVRQFGYVTDPL
jgi:hypothetical protein